MKKRTHALLTPWPISQGLHTWCGYKHDDERVAGENVAAAPESVTCEECIRAMRLAWNTLGAWITRLKTGEK